MQHRQQQRRDQLQRDHPRLATDQLTAPLMAFDPDLDAAQLTTAPSGANSRRPTRSSRLARVASKSALRLPVVRPTQVL